MVLLTVPLISMKVVFILECTCFDNNMLSTIDQYTNSVAGVLSTISKSYNAEGVLSDVKARKLSKLQHVLLLCTLKVC